MEVLLVYLDYSIFLWAMESFFNIFIIVYAYPYFDAMKVLFLTQFHLKNADFEVHRVQKILLLILGFIFLWVWSFGEKKTLPRNLNTMIYGSSKAAGLEVDGSLIRPETIWKCQLLFK